MQLTRKDFLPRRVAKVYAEKIKALGKEKADEWWATFPWRPDDETRNFLSEMVAEELSKIR